MATDHGNKKYCQILLDPYRFAEAEKLAAEAGIRTNAWMRDAIYRHMERVLPASVYNDAVAKDTAAYREAIRRRIQRRTEGKQQKSET